MGREISVDIQKAVAAFCVVLLHVTSLGWYYNENVNQWPGYIVLIEIGSIGVPLFFIATGIIMLQKERKNDIGKIIKHNIPRLIVALIVYSTLYEFCDFVIGDKSGNFAIIFIKDFLTVNIESRLWFMYAIICTYLMIPVIKVFTDNATRSQKEYFLVVWFLCAILEFLGNTTPFEFVSEYTNNLAYVTFFIHYVGYLILGNYLSSIQVKRKVMWVMGVLSALSFVYIIILFYYQYSNGQIEYLTYTVMDYCSPFNIIIVSFVTMLIKNAFYKNESCWLIKKVGKIGTASLGIYLIHVGVIRIVDRHKMITFSDNYILEIIIITCILYVVSTIVALIIKKVPIIGKWIG